MSPLGDTRGGGGDYPVKEYKVKELQGIAKMIVVAAVMFGILLTAAVEFVGWTPGVVGRVFIGLIVVGFFAAFLVVLGMIAFRKSRS